MELKPNSGLGEIKFGMQQSETEQILGPATRIRVDEDDESRLMLDFNQHKIRLIFFRDESNRLGYIETALPDLSYRGKAIIGRPVEEVLELLSDLEPDWEIENYRSFDSYFNELHWLTLFVEYGCVINVSMGVPFMNDEEYNWPL